MLLVVSGVSGAGKTTARWQATALLGPEFEPVELWHFPPLPAEPTIAWRQQTLERVARRAVELDADGRHLLLAGDPVPAGEILAVPSADLIDIAVCLLDVDAATLNARLDERGDPLELRPLHLGFADWLRHHATDPQYVTAALTTGCWPSMRWERWLGADVADVWAMTIIDNSHLSPEEAGHRLAQWCRAAVAGDAPVFRRGWHRREPGPGTGASPVGDGPG